MAKLTHSIYYVEDVASTLQFYSKAFLFQIKFITPEKDYGELETGSTKLSFASIELGNSNIGGGFQESDLTTRPYAMEMSIETEHPGEVIDRAVDCGAILEEPLITKSWGQEVGYLRDPNGLLIAVCSPLRK